MSQFHGATALLGPIIRRDRVRLVVWVASLLLLVLITAVSTKDIYPTQAELTAVAVASADNPAALAFNGPAVALDTIGGQVAFQLGAFGLTMVALMSTLLTGRFTRAEEETGRLELVRSMPIGRHAPLVAAVVVVGATDLVVGALSALVLTSQDLPVAGSVALGGALAAAGLFFTALAALTAQLSDNARVTAGIAGAVLGGSFAVRAVGDAYAPGLSWASPIGLAQKSRPYGGEVWWPLVLALVLAAGLLVVAVHLANRRDFGSGLVPARPGPAEAAPTLGRPLGLAVRLSRASILWWTFGIVALALVYGSLASAIEDFVSDSETMEDYFARSGDVSLTDAFLSTCLLLNSLLPAGAAVQALSRIRAEELEGRAEAVLATPTSRLRWFASHVIVALAGSSLALVAGGLALGASASLVLGDAGELVRLTAASLVYLPAVWALVGIAVALIGLVPRASVAVWGVWGFALVVAFFGTLVDFPRLLRDLSPFEHIPLVPAADVDPAPLGVLLVVSAGLLAAGGAGLRRRDVAT